MYPYVFYGFVGGRVVLFRKKHLFVFDPLFLNMFHRVTSFWCMYFISLFSFKYLNESGRPDSLQFLQALEFSSQTQVVLEFLTGAGVPDLILGN